MLEQNAGVESANKSHVICYRNASFVFLSTKTTIDQIPIGRPIQMQGDIHGIIARMDAVIASG